MRQLLTDLRGNPIYQSNGSWRGTQRSFHYGNHHHRHHAGAGSGSASSVVNPNLHNPRSLLFLSVTSADWDETIRRAQSHPQEVLMVDDNGNTPLHRACQLDPPVDVVRALQEAATQTNAMGATPLHVAASHRCNASALQALIDYYKGGLSQQSRMGRTPIHYACTSYRGLDLVAFQTLLEATLEESRNLLWTRRQQEQEMAAQNNNNNNNDESDEVTTTLGGGGPGTTTFTGSDEVLKITDFIDILRERGDGDHDTIDDEDLSVLVVDDPSTGLAHMSTNDTLTIVDDEEDDDENNEDDGEDNPNKDNTNIVTWKDATGNTPLGLLFRRYRERVKSVISVLEQMRTNPASATPTTSPTSLQTDLGHLWGKARLIVARLTEEQQEQQQQQQQLVVTDLANPSAAQQSASSTAALDGHQNDDSSSSGSSYGEHWTAAAAWSSERFHGKPSLTTFMVSQTNPVTSSLNADVPIAGHHSEEDSDKGETAAGETTLPDLQVKKERQFRIVHASVALTGYGCPPEMIRLAISIHPHQVREMDEDGNLPLHIAATASSFGAINSSMTMADDASVFSDGMASLFSAGSSSKKDGEAAARRQASFEKVIKLLLKHYPQAAKTPHGRSGRLPLVLAARAGHRSWGDGMKALLRAYPPALFSGSKGLVPIKLYAHILSLIGGGGPPPPPPPPATATPPSPSSTLTAASTHSFASNGSSSGLHSSLHSCGVGGGKGSSSHFKGIGFLHNFLLLKQRHMRERMAVSPAPSSHWAPSPPRNGRQRNHLNRREYGGSGGGSNHSRSHGMIEPNSNHSHDKPASPPRNSSWTSKASSKKQAGSLATTTATATAKKPPLSTAGPKKIKPGKKVDPKLATTMFELLRTKPDLVELGRAYHADLLKKQRRAAATAQTDRCTTNDTVVVDGGNSSGQWLRRKRTMSRKIFDRMTVFERKRGGLD